jgi:hypothetical protein
MFKVSLALALLAFGVAGSPPDLATAQSEAGREWMSRQYLRMHEHVRGGVVEPHWLGNGERFWFIDHGPDETPVYLVDPTTPLRRRLFDLKAVRERLARGFEGETLAGDLPVRDLRINEQNEELLELALGTRWIEVDTGSGEVRLSSDAAIRSIEPPPNAVVAPGGGRAAGIADHDVSLRSLGDGTEQALTTDGTLDRPWGGPGDRRPQILWNPDGSKLVVTRLDRRAVAKIPILLHLTDPPEVQWAYHWRSEGPFESTDLLASR